MLSTVLRVSTLRLIQALLYHFSLPQVKLMPKRENMEMAEGLQQYEILWYNFDTN